MMGNESIISQFFNEYRRATQIDRFFEQYRKTLQATGRAPSQNFLMATELLRHLEVEWCRVLWWLLNPQSCERRARQFQQGLMGKQGLNAGRDWPLFTAVKREVIEAENRYDLELGTSAGRQVLIETKVRSPWDAAQYRRITTRCRDVHYITLRDPPRVCPSCTWSQVGAILRQIVVGEAIATFEARRWDIIALDFADVIEHESAK